MAESARGGLLRKGKRFLQLLDGGGGAGDAYLRLVGQIPRELADGLIGDAWPRAEAGDAGEAAGGPLDDLFDQAPPGGVDRLLYVDFHSYLPDDLLVKMDRASMAFSLEARSPFLDHLLLEEVARMPAELKLRGLRRGLGRGSGSKWVLRRAMRELLPAEVLKRPKMGFGVPLEHWFRGPSAGWLRETLLDGELVRAELLRGEAVGDLIARHPQGGEDHANRPCVLAVLELWWRCFLGAPTPWAGGTRASCARRKVERPGTCRAISYRSAGSSATSGRSSSRAGSICRSGRSAASSFQNSARRTSTG